MSNLEIKTRTTEAAGILELHGRLTLGEGDLELRRAVADLVSQGFDTVVLNLKALAYTDSAGIGEMIAATTVLAQRRGALFLAEPSSKVRDLLGRFPHVLNIVDTEEEALRGG